MFFVLVLPFEPVMPTTRRGAGRPSASTRVRGAHPDARDDLVCERGEGLVPVGDDDLRRGGVHALGRDHQGGTGVDRCGHEPSTVGDLTGQGEEDAAGADQAGVGLDRALDDQVAGLGDDRGGDLGEGHGDHRTSSAGPEFGSQPASRRATRASSRAEYGVRTPWMSR
jgi:hypothetical protein